VHYDDLPHFTAHWFIDNATEHVEEPDQPNVYDTLYRQIGINPAHVAPRYKRPVVGFSQADWQDLQSIYATCHAKEGVDLRVLPYVILAPCAYSSLRAAPYQMWLNLAQQLSEKYTVIFVGRTSDEGQLPIPDITFGEFYQRLVTLAQQSKHRIINLIGPTPLRPIMALIARSLGIVALDSGLLYVAQASRVPAVSLWGTHAPHTRLLYDPAYMRGAIWKRDSCKHSPCFAYAGFPVDRCPTGPGTRVCNVLATITSEEVVERLERVLNDENGARPPEPIIQPEIAKPAVGQVDVKS
jgi:ADP-heptose:LPS heptosyltransferase